MAADRGEGASDVLPGEVTSLVAEFAQFLVALGVPSDDRVVEDFPEGGDAWFAFLNAKGVEVLVDDDDEVIDGGAFPLMTEDEQSCELLNTELGAQLVLAHPSGLRGGSPLGELLEAFDAVAAATSVDFDIDIWARSGFGVDDRELLDECRQRSEGSGAPEYLLKVWVDALAAVWCGQPELQVDWYAWPLPWGLSPDLVAHRDDVLARVGEAFAGAGLLARWDGDQERLWLSGFALRP